MQQAEVAAQQGSGVLVNACTPGFIDTDLTKGMELPTPPSTVATLCCFVCLASQETEFTMAVTQCAVLCTSIEDQEILLMSHKRFCLL